MTTLRLRALGALTLASVALPLAAAASASATTAPQAPPAVAATDLSAAHRAAESTTALSLIDTAAHQAVARAGSAADAVGEPQFAPTDVTVYALSAPFVKSGTGPVATLWYVATTVHQAGATLTVFATKHGGSWQAVNVASGDIEAQMATLADGAPLFTEPQIGAWYALTGREVRPLNAEARQAIGAASVPVATYQRQVAARYANRQRGSTYDKQGLAGGFGATSVAQQTRPEHGSGIANDLVIPAVIAASVCVGVGLVLRLRSLSD